jgi:hypothetical protein
MGLVHTRRALCFVVLGALGLVGCFSPDFGQGAVRCGEAGHCPPGYACAGDDHCYTKGLMPDLAGVVIIPPNSDLSIGPDISCTPTKQCRAFCGTLPDDGCGRPLTCDCLGAHICSSKTANSCDCTRLTSCDQAPGVHCGQYPDGCGGVLTCAPCPIGQMCGFGGAFTCGPHPPMCKGNKCKTGQCGIISDGCSGILDCGNCPAGQVCGGGGAANYCS